MEREDYESAAKLHTELSAMKQNLLLAKLGDGEKQLRLHLSRRPTDQANLLQVVSLARRTSTEQLSLSLSLSRARSLSVTRTLSLCLSLSVSLSVSLSLCVSTRVSAHVCRHIR